MLTTDLLRRHFHCPACRAHPLEVKPFAMDGPGIVHGVISCPKCRNWYRIEDGLAELLIPALRHTPALDAFTRRFRDRWEGWEAAADSAGGGSEHKLEQKSFYDADAVGYESSMLQLPFWKAVDAASIGSIAGGGTADKILLEIGCGTGRISIPTAGRFAKVLGFDISETMVRTAMKKRAQTGAAGRDIHYFVADAENIPVRAETADAALLYGILHHVESPSTVLAETARCLRAGGTLFGCENNRSLFRPIFDFLMLARKLWNEKAHEEHFIISHRILKEWFAGTGLRSAVWTSVFLPPHLFNLLSPANARRLLALSDGLGSALPWLRWQGGLLMFSGRKEQRS
ncbi:MAG: methyltransferase domain-containing protein [Elusimicrobiota bacterium]